MATDNSEIFSVIITAGGSEVVLDNSDIVQCYFIEDIYSWCMAGKLILKDTRAIIEFLPLVGDEIITIIYRTWDVEGGTKIGSQGDGEAQGDGGAAAGGTYDERVYSFEIFKVSEISATNQNTVGAREIVTMYGIEIFFVQREHKLLHQNYYSRTYIDKKYIDIIKDMAKRYIDIGGYVRFESAVEEIEFFHTGLRTPAQGLLWLMERIKGDDSGQSGFMFYHSTEASEVSWNFITLEKLLRDGPLIAPPIDGIYTMGSANQHNLNNLTNIIISCVDQSSLNRLSACNMLGYDIYRKYMVKREYVYQDGNDRYTTLGDYTLFNKDNIALKKPQEILTGESGDKYMLVECLLDNIHFSEWVKQYNLQQLVSVMVRGDVRRYCGGQIEINWLSGNTDEKFNKNMMGRYLIKSITHQFSGQTMPQYIQKMVLIKNGYWDSDSMLTPASKPKKDYIELDSPEPSVLVV